MIEFPPGLLLILGAILVPLLPQIVRNGYMLALPVIGFWGLLMLPEGVHFGFDIFGYSLAPVRVDGLSLVFGYIFHIAAAISIIFAFHVKDTVQQMAGLMYAGAAIGGVFAGDLISLFVYWEGTAIASVFLIWSSRTEPSYRSGMRYLTIQVGSGVLLLAGTILYFKNTGSIEFTKMGLTGIGPALIFIAFGIKAAFPLLHNWLQDSYPQATVTGTVFLSAFTTKLAIYALARGFPGTDMLIWIGAAMAIFPIFYAIIESDLRRVLAYSLNHQLGFMVVGIGIGTELSLNGTTAHAFASVLYKGLLFMSMGAVLYRTYDRLAGSALRFRRCDFSFRHSNSVFYLFPQRLRKAPQRGTRQYVGGYGNCGVPLHCSWRLSSTALHNFALPDQICPLHDNSCRNTVTTDPFRSTCLYLFGKKRPLSIPVEIHQS